MISIIVPIYHAEKYLERCLDSLLAQRFQDFEILCAGSEAGCDPDEGTFAIAHAYAARFPDKIRVLRQKEGHSSGGARNAGLDAAAGHYVMFVDNDDVVDPGILEKMLLTLEKENVDIAFCGFDRIQEYSGKIIGIDMVSKAGVYEVNAASLADLICFSPAPWGKLYRRKLIGEKRFAVGRTAGCEDCAFYLGLLPAIRRYTLLPEVLYHYYVRSKSLIAAGATLGDYRIFYSLLAGVQKKYEQDHLPPYYLDMLTYAVFIHAGIASLFHLAEVNADMKQAVQDSRNFLNAEFPRWKEIPLVPGNKASIHTLLVWICVQAHRIQVMRPLLWTYRRLSRWLGSTGKW